MLFNSYIFLLGFLPVTLCGFFAACTLGENLASVWLVGASLVFYGWWNPGFLPVLIVSVAFNYGMSRIIDRAARGRELLLGLAIAGDIGALIYYKYLVSMVGFLHDWFGAGIFVTHITLPLGISFFTFTQIGYLVDVAQGVAKDRGLLRYLLFVTFFPHLIAGPILHNREVMPQFGLAATWRPSGMNLAVGSTIFVMGLLKKCVLADPLAAVAAPGFADPAHQALFAAWHAALAYSLQLYFDFSGYSDMAIGLARMFNITFPQNFNSPYKAVCVIEYWQRWHMTLTRYLNLYLYNPVALAITRRRMARGLGVNRKALATPDGFVMLTVVPTMFTMLSAGIWHGAGFQFLVFGVLHGFYLVVNHAWRIFGPARREGGDTVYAHIWKVALTYLCVLVGAVFFRAPSCGAAVHLLASMLGSHGMGGAVGSLRSLVRDVGAMACLYGIVWFMPNTQEIMRAYEPVLRNVPAGPFAFAVWQPTLRWAIVTGLGATLGVLAIGGTTEFLYFQF